MTEISSAGPTPVPLAAPPALDPQAALFADVDGTLLEIAARPELVQVPAELPGLLEALARHREGAFALVSGRPLAELDRLFAPWRGAAAGLHGGERRRSDGSRDDLADPAAAAALDALRPELAALVGGDGRMLLEDKGGTLALHYRGAPERETALHALATRLCVPFDDTLRLIAGKMVLEFQPRRRDKGTAIAAFLVEEPFRGRRPVFIGDDVTDEHGFAEVVRRGGLAIRIGPPAATAARHALPSVAAARAWLAAGKTGRNDCPRHGGGR